MSAQGVTYVACSGDHGTNTLNDPSGFNYDYPSYDGEVMMIGGTIATTNAAGQRTSEIAWDGGGGGWTLNPSPLNVLPTWQHGKGVPPNVNHRLSPDVSLNAAGPNFGGAYYYYLNGALTSDFVGTSFATPVFAGALAAL